VPVKDNLTNCNILCQSKTTWPIAISFHSTLSCHDLAKTAKSIFIFLFFSIFIILFLFAVSFLLPSPSPGARWPPGVVLYPTPPTNIVIMSPIHFISHCPLGQHICAFMHWGHEYHSMFPLHLLFAEAGKGHYLGTELMARGNPLLKRILWTLSLNDTHTKELPIAYHKYMCSSTKSRYHLWEVY